MDKDFVSDKQGINLILLFVLGSNVILGAGNGAKNDAWISILLSLVCSIPLVLMYARLLSLFKDKNLFQINKIILGKVFGKIVNIIYVLFFSHIGALVLRNFGEFIITIALDETPLMVIIMVFVLVCLAGAAHGTKILGRWSELNVKLVLIFILLAFLLLIPLIDLNNLTPILYNGFKPVLKASFTTFTFPFGETIVFLGVLSIMQSRKSSYKIFLRGVIYGGIIILLLTTLGITVLGVNEFTESYFPMHVTAARIDIGDFLQRMEVIIIIPFLMAGFVKTVICIISIKNGLKEVFNKSNISDYLILIGFFVLILSNIIFDNIQQMIEWGEKSWASYAIIFEFFIPFIIWIIAEYKYRNKEI